MKLNFIMKKVALKSYDKLINDSYDRIIKGFFFDKNFKPYTEDFFDKMIQYYSDLEEYEKCSIVLDIKKLRFDHNLNWHSF